MALTIDTCRAELRRLGERRLYWFKSGTYESVAGAWLSVVGGWLDDPKLAELSQLYQAARAYLARNAFMRFWQWLFTDIGRRLELLAYYECCNALRIYAVSRVSVRVNREELDKFLGTEAWLLAALSQGSALREVFSSLLELLRHFGGGLPKEPLPSAIPPYTGRFSTPVNLALPEPQATSKKDCYSYLGAGVNADTTIAGLELLLPKGGLPQGPLPSAIPPYTGRFSTPVNLALPEPQATSKKGCYSYLGSDINEATPIADLKKAYRKQVLIEHPDKRADKSDEEFKKLQAAYVLAVYKRTLPPYCEDAGGILAKEDLEELEKLRLVEGLDVAGLSVDNVQAYFAESLDKLRADVRGLNVKLDRLEESTAVLREKTVILQKETTALQEERAAMRKEAEAVHEQYIQTCRHADNVEEIVRECQQPLQQINEFLSELPAIMAQAEERGDRQTIDKIKAALATLAQMGVYGNSSRQPSVEDVGDCYVPLSPTARR